MKVNLIMKCNDQYIIERFKKTYLLLLKINGKWYNIGSYRSYGQALKQVNSLIL